jgi:phospholipid/cholesterol/gamma-HCH transport system substrate-binding protein
MKRENEFVVGVVVVVAFVVIVVGTLWLSGTHIGKAEKVYTARFRTLGGLSAGTPVVLRGVRVGRVEGIRLNGVALPAKPAVIAASASLFGEWAATLVPQGQLPDDPIVRQAIAEAAAGAGSKWPGATLPDIGELTAQASRIASDIGLVANRVENAFDTAAVAELRKSIRDFGQVASRLARVTNDVGANLHEGSDALSHAATMLSTTLGRVDSATNRGELATILGNSAVTSQDLRKASQNLRDIMDAAHNNQQSIVRALVAADTIMSRIVNRNGTLGLFVSDSALYRETTLTMIQLRQLLSDIQANPRKYFKFSVF